MTPEISEFSFGFALTNELVGWSQLKAAPIFPSLIEEGKKGGGYDVKLDMPGTPLYLQFKRSHCMVRRTAREIKHHHAQLSVPFHRFYITESGTSDQHQMLLELDDGVNAVFYVAPRFHLMNEINAAWETNAVASRSIFVAPQAIGILDDSPHHVAFDEHFTYLCSEPKSIECLAAAQLASLLSDRLAADLRPLRNQLPELSSRLHGAIQRALPKMSERAKTGKERQRFEEYASAVVNPSERVPTLRQMEMQEPVELQLPQRQLRELADKAQKVFDAQLVIVQKSS